MLRRFLLKLRSYLPRRLPTGRAEFMAMAEDIVALSGLPMNTSTLNLAAAMVMTLPPTQAYVRLNIISNRMVKAAANQVASAILKETVDAKAQETA